MDNWLTRPYCEFDPVEWEQETGIQCDIDQSSTRGSEALSCYYDSQVGDRCELHHDIDSVSVPESSNAIIKHFQTADTNPNEQFAYNTVVGAEIPGFDLKGRTFRAESNRKIDIRHLISHGVVDFVGGTLRAD